MDENLRKKLRNLDSRLKHPVEQDISALREWYDTFLPESERQEFKEWISQVSKVIDDRNLAWGIRPVRLSHLIEELNGFSLTPQVILKAITAWESGEEYLNTSTDNLQ